MPLVINVEEKPELIHSAHSFHRRLRTVLMPPDPAQRIESPALAGTVASIRPNHRPRHPARLPLRGYKFAIRRWIRQIKKSARWSWQITSQLTRFSFDLLRFLEYISSERGDCN